MGQNFRADDEVVMWFAAVIKQAGGRVKLTDAEVAAISRNDLVTVSYDSATRTTHYVLVENAHPKTRLGGRQEKQLGRHMTDGAKQALELLNKKGTEDDETVG